MKLAVVFVILLHVSPGALKYKPVQRMRTRLHDDNVAFAVNAINEHTSRLNGTARFGTRLLSATVQVGAGFIYKFQIEVTNGTTNEMCNVTVNSKPWAPLPNLRAERVECESDGETQTGNEGVESPGESTKPNCTVAQTTVAPTTYPPLELDTAAKSALLYLVERYNAPRSVIWRVVPYDVTVQKVITHKVHGILFRFSLRMVVSKCSKPDVELFGKITLEECPPYRDQYLVYNRPKCQADVVWNPSSMGAVYTYNGVVCPRD